MTKKDYSQYIMPASILIAAMILSMSLFSFGAGLERGLNNMSGAIAQAEFKLQVEATAPERGGSLVPTPQQEEDNGVKVINMQGLIQEEDASKGGEEATVTVLEYTDFQCPFCAKYFEDTHGLIKKNYVENGKIKYVLKHFPLSFHPESQKAAEAFECANEQGAAWEMYEKLFSNRETLSMDNYKKWAAEIDLKTSQFNECLDSGAMADKVKNDMALGLKAGIEGTPSFIINGKMLVGAQPYAAFEAAIEDALNE